MSGPFCAGGEKATVDFKLGTVGDSVVIEKNLPITIQTESNPPHTYKFKFQFRGCPGDRGNPGCWVVAADYSGVRPGDEFGNRPSEGAYFVSVFTLSGPPTQESAQHSGCPVCSIVRVKDPAGTVLLNNLANVSWERVDCSIKINDSTGAIVFDRSGECPVSFTVACGDECPEGYCKCSTLKYPGYCCCKCSNH